MRLAVDVSVGGKAMSSAKPPAIKLSLDVHVTDVDAAGDIHYEFVIASAAVVVEAGTDANAANTMQASLADMVGLHGSVVITNRGITKEARFDVPARTDEQIQRVLPGMKDALHQLAAPFPLEAVGRGAKWQVDSNVVSNEMKVAESAVYELTRLEGDQLDASVTLTQTAGAQDVPLSSTDGSHEKFHLTALTSTGGGTLQLDLQQVVPTRSKLDLATDLKATIGSATPPQEMNMEMEMGIEATSH
jgi:hypothetical protein